MKTQFFPWLRDKTWAKTLGILTVKRKCFFKLYDKFDIKTCLLACAMPRLLILFILKKLIKVPKMGSTVQNRRFTNLR